jgi:transaldolase
MEIFLDTADVNEVEEYMQKYPFVTGITTNPAMLAMSISGTLPEYLKRMREVAGKDTIINVQVSSSKYTDMVTEAEKIVDLCGPNTCVKMPATEEGIRAMAVASKKGIGVTATLVASFVQGVMALEAGVKYCAVFYGPMRDNMVDGLPTLEQLVAYKKQSGCTGKLLAAGFRNYELIGPSVKAGVDAITIHPSVLSASMCNATTDQYIVKFGTAWSGKFGNTNVIDLL